MEADSDLDQLMAHLGEFGRWQRGQYALQALSALTAGVHMLSLVTVAAVPDHRCVVAGVDDPASPRFGDAAALARLPLDALGRPRPCLAPLAAGGGNASAACPALQHVFAAEHHAGSLAARWHWVCERRWMGAAAQSAFMFGVFTGAVVLGALADRYGRKPVFCVSAVLQCVLGVAVAFSNDFYAFLALRFLYGVFGSAGAYITGFVLAMEMVGASRRTVCGIAFQGLFAAGVMLVALWGYLIRDATQLQVVYGLHGALLLGHWWLLAESPRWLWAQGRVKEAVDVVASAVRVNGGPPLDAARFVSRGKAAADGRRARAHAHGLADLVRTPRLRARTLLACLNWFANSLVYYGLSLNTGGLAGDPFLVLFLVGLVELPSYVATVALLDRTGRRPLVAALMLLGGTLCAAAAYLPPGAPATAAVLTGKFFIAGSFAIIYNYSAELFPTVVRNSALGLGSMCARLSGALTPLITLLDTFEPRLPAALFGGVAVASGLLSLLLPETLNKALPQTVEDGEAFGRGDTACAACCRRAPSPPPSPPPTPPHAQPLASPRHI